MHTDQEPHFIVIGTIYFMSQWLYFFVPPILFFFISVSALQNVVAQLHCCCCYSNSWCMKTVITRWMWRGKSTVNRCCIRVSSWDQSSTINLSDIQCLPYINLQLPACQNYNVYLFSCLSLAASLWHFPSKNVWCLQAVVCFCILFPSYTLCPDTYFSCLPAAEQHQMTC